MQQSQSEQERDEQEARNREAAYRRGYSQATDETARLVLQLVNRLNLRTQILG